MKLKQVIKWGGSVIVAVIIGLYIELVLEMREYEPSLLVSCIDVDTPWVAWTCKQILLHDSLKPDQVETLNHEAGAKYPVLMKDAATADEILALFIARRVEINTGDEITKSNWTALHGMVAFGKVDQAKLLLKYGARTDTPDKQGMTPLDIARIVQQKHPANPNMAEMVRLLEEADKKQR